MFQQVLLAGCLHRVQQLDPVPELLAGGMIVFDVYEGRVG